MQFTFNHYESPEVLTATAGFLLQLAAIATDRDNPAAVAPVTEPPQFSVDLATGAATLVKEHDDGEVLILSNDPEFPPGAGGLATLGDSNMVGQPRVDMKGVMFNPDFCSEAKDPFYSSGPNVGQWKCKRGVPGATYDHWYQSQLAPAPAAEQDAVDVSQAFATTAPAAAAPAKSAPRNCGELMVWVSEQQVAGNVTQDQVQAAYTRHNLGLADLLPPNVPDVIEQRVALIYGDLA